MYIPSKAKPFPSLELAKFLFLKIYMSIYFYQILFLHLLRLFYISSLFWRTSRFSRELLDFLMSKYSCIPTWSTFF